MSRPALPISTTDYTPRRPPVRYAIYLVWALGLLLFSALLVRHGLGDVLAALKAAGWGIAVIVAYHVLPLAANALSWRSLLPPGERRSPGAMMRMRWVSESVNALLPVLQLGGEVVRTRLLHRAGVPGPSAGASVIADITAGILTQIVFSLMGIVVLLRIGGTVQALEIVLGLLFLGLMLWGFYRAQHNGLIPAIARRLERLAGDRARLSLEGGASALDRAVVGIYREPHRFWTCAGWHLASWLLGVGETWLALRFLGHPVGLTEALMLESLIQAIRSAGFAIPGALGLQEGGLILLGGLIGVPPATSLALSLIKRVRELAVGLPALLAWQLAEGRHLWHSQGRARP